MKKFILSILCVTVFFIGLGGIIQETGARFKSDERALNLIKQAQTAIGGETAIQNVKSLSINGNVVKTFEIEGVSKAEQGKVEINLQLPNQFVKSMKLGNPDNLSADKTAELKKEVNVLVMREGGETPVFKLSEADGGNHRVFIRKKDADGKVILNDETVNTEGRKILVDKDVIHNRIGGFHQNELFRTTIALLMTAPQGADVTFRYLGDGDVDGNGCDIVEATTGNSSVKLFLDKSSHLPRMMSYQGFKPMIIRLNKDKNEATTETRVMTNRLEKPEATEIQVRFADYRSVNGVLLPHRWTQTVGGNADETFDVSGYEINPANIAEKFQNVQPRTFVRTERKAQ